MYDAVVRHVEVQVVPVRMRWTEWEDAVGPMVQFYEWFDTVEVMFSVHENTGGTIGRGWVWEF